MPEIVAGPDIGAQELGVKFTADVAGLITGIRFYKGATNTGSHSGTLWSSSGALLATAMFTNESASGWQQVNFATRSRRRQQRVRRLIPRCRVFAFNDFYFASAGFDNPPLHAMRSG